MPSTATTATRLTDKFRRDVERVSRDRISGEIVKRLKAEFSGAAEVRSLGRKTSAVHTSKNAAVARAKALAKKKRGSP